jgi:hypothetical protein
VKLYYKQDPGHGWLQVPVPTILSIFKDEIEAGALPLTAYSYMDTAYFYCEEDVDMGVVLDRFAELGIEVKIVATSTKNESFIRKLENIQSKMVANVIKLWQALAERGNVQVTYGNNPPFVATPQGKTWYIHAPYNRPITEALMSKYVRGAKEII